MVNITIIKYEKVLAWAKLLKKVIEWLKNRLQWRYLENDIDFLVI